MTDPMHNSLRPCRDACRGDGSASRKKQSGYAIAAVSFIGMIAMAGAATMMTTGPVAEVAEIENSLMQVRGHWASVGMFTYAISRGRQDGACDTSCNQGDRTRAETYQFYAEEIYNSKNNKFDRKNPTQRRWSYPELNDDYILDYRSTVSDLDAVADDGRLLIESPLFQLGDFFENKNQLVPNASVRAVFCTGLATATSACLTTIADANTGGITRVQDFRIVRP